MKRVLFVDDEPGVLASFQRLLRKQFQVETALGGTQGLRLLAERPPFAVIVSDMRMPGMDGVQFLARAKQMCPDSVRMILTGYADMQAAIDAVNEGSIFRFLTKPCPHQTLVQALEAGLEQYRLVVAEKQLLEQTLQGSVAVLSEVLSLVNPPAFSRSWRIRHYVRHIVSKFKLPGAWQFEVAAMLSQIGCVTLTRQLLEDVYAGKQLPEPEQNQFLAHPRVAHDLLARIPRLEAVAGMIARQFEPFSKSPATADIRHQDPETLGAHLLKLTLDYDQLITRGVEPPQALAELKRRQGEYDPLLLAALEDLPAETDGYELREVPADQLATGMALDTDLRSSSGLLLVAKGQQITPALLARLHNLVERGMVPDRIRVRVPVRQACQPSAGAAQTNRDTQSAPVTGSPCPSETKADTAAGDPTLCC